MYQYDGPSTIITDLMAADYAAAIHPNGGGGPVLLVSDDGGIAASTMGKESGDLTMGGMTRRRMQPVPPPPPYACSHVAIFRYLPPPLLPAVNCFDPSGKTEERKRRTFLSCS